MSDTDFPAPSQSPAFDDDTTWSALADYVSGHATPAVIATIDARAAADPTYAALVASVQAVWAIPFAAVVALDDNGSDDITDDITTPLGAATDDPIDVDAAWTTFAATLPPLPAASTGAPPSPVDSPPPPLVVTSTIPAVNPPTPGRRRARRPSSSSIVSVWRRHPVLWATFTVVLVYLTGVQVDHHSWHRRFYYHAGATAQVVTLPDGSHATLAPGAYLGTGRTFVHGSRDVYLFGQAHFTVTPNTARPFTVHVLDVDAAALGTTFTVFSDTTARVTVDVDEGKVELSLPGADGTVHTVGVLTAGQARNVLAVTRWFAKAGFMVGEAGVPFDEARRIHAALVRAAAAVAPRAP